MEWGNSKFWNKSPWIIHRNVSISWEHTGNTLLALSQCTDLNFPSFLFEIPLNGAWKLRSHTHSQIPWFSWVSHFLCIILKLLGHGQITFAELNLIHFDISMSVHFCSACVYVIQANYNLEALLIMLLILCDLMFSLGLSLKADFSGIQWRVSEGCFSILYQEIPTFLSFTLNQMNLKSFKWKVRSGFISENLHKAWGIFKGKMPKRSMQHQLLVQTMIALDQSPCTYLPETFWG